jgi:SPP1 gp7 family putative phage head morphogenesis protein
MKKKSQKKYSYWADRINYANEYNRQKSLEQVEKELAEIYQHQAVELKAEIYAVFDKIESDNYIINDLYRNNRYWELLGHINEKLRELGADEIEITEDFLIKVYQFTQEEIEKEVPGVLRPSSSFLNVDAIDAHTLVDKAWCSDGLTLSDRIWKNKKLLMNSIENGMQDMFIQGKSPWEIATMISRLTGQSEKNAYRLARTESAHIMIKASCDKYTQMGFTHGIYYGVNCCDQCQELTGKRYTLKELESLIPQHPNCTCTYKLEVPKR